MRFETLLDTTMIFDNRFVWEVIPQAIGLLGGLIVPL